MVCDKFQLCDVASLIYCFFETISRTGTLLSKHLPGILWLDILTFYPNKKLYRAFSRQANGLTLNISVLEGLLRVNGKAEKDV